MRGGQVFMEALALNGANAIFGNPGTTENSLLDRLIDYPDIRYFTALHEGVAVSAASFYAQASGRVAVANLHVAPGLGNAIGAIYGALKANSPLIVTAGAQDTRMRLNDPLLGHDLVAMATPVVKWAVQPASADEIAPIMRRAFQVATQAPAGPVFVALPVDVMEQETDIPAASANTVMAPAATPDDVASAVEMILESQQPAILVGDEPIREGAFEQIVALAEHIGAPVYHEGLHAQMSFPNRHRSYGGRIPFEAAATARLLADNDLIILLGGTFFEDVWFDDCSPLPPDSQVLQINSDSTRIGRNFPITLGITAAAATTVNAINLALELAPHRWRDQAAQRNTQLETRASQVADAQRQQLDKLWDAQPMSPPRALHEIAEALPERVIVVDESITTSLEVGGRLSYQRPGDYYGARGGGIGQGIAGALGVQIAHPERPVLAISGDGSAMYSIQAFWSAAHHNLPIVFVILSNREYRVLKHNLDIYRQRFDVASNKPYPHMDLSEPTLDFAAMAAGMGVSGTTITDPEEIAGAIQKAFASAAPALIEVVISGKP